MSTDLVPIPLTGEALDLNGPDGDLAAAFDQVRDLERQLAEARRVIGDELIRRMDRAASWTLRVGDFKVSAPSPEPKIEFDVESLRAVLADLVAEGVISSEAAAGALRPEVTYKPSVRGINAVRKLGLEVAARLDGCAVEKPKDRRVRVEIERAA